MADESLRAAIEVSLSAGGAAAGGEQLGLELFDDMASPMDLLREDTRGVEPRGRGRPVGSRNREDLDLIRLIKATKRPALLALKEITETSPAELARMLGCKRVEAFDRWYRALELMVAYEEGRPTQAVDLKGGALVLPTVVFMDQPVRDDLVDGNPPIEGEATAVVDFTQQSGATSDDVSREMSHGEAEGEQDQSLRLL